MVWYSIKELGFHFQKRLLFNVDLSYVTFLFKPIHIIKGIARHIRLEK